LFESKKITIDKNVYPSCPKCEPIKTNSLAKIYQLWSKQLVV